MRNSTDYTDQICELYSDWSYDHLIRCNRFCKIYVDPNKDISQAVKNYRSAYMNKVD